MPPYNPRAYVPGGSTKKVATAIQKKGYAKTPKGQAPAGVPKKKTQPKKAPPRPYAGHLSPAEVNAQAVRHAQKILDEATKPLAAQSERTAAQYRAAGEGLAQSLAPLSGQIRDLYAGNAASQAGLARGYSGAVQGVLNAEQASQGASQAQLGMPGLGGSFSQETGNVIYGTGGALPAQTMGHTGTGFAAAAAFAPGAARSQAMGEAATAKQKFADQIAELRAKQPEVYASLLESGRANQDRLADNNINARAQRLYELKFGMDANASAGLDASGNLQPGYTLAPDGQTVIPPGYSYNTKTGQVTKTAGKSNSKTAGERKAETRAAAVEKRNSETADAVVDMGAWLQAQMRPTTVVSKGKPVSAGHKVNPFDGSKIPLYRLKGGGTTKDPNHPDIQTQDTENQRPAKINYKIARDYIRGQLRARLSRFGWRPAQINEMAARILAENHINPPKGPPKPAPNLAARAKPRGG